MFAVKPTVASKSLSAHVNIGGASLRPQARAAVRFTARTQPKTVSFFDFLKPKKSVDVDDEPAPARARGGGGAPPPSAYICLDCGYIFEGDFAAAPFFYKCPVCGVGKNRFQKNMSQGDYYNAMASAKRANKAASREKRKDSPRELLKQRQRELGAEKDGKGKGPFGR